MATLGIESTGYRLNDLLGGGLEILDEVSDDDDPRTEKYIRAKYDPVGAQQRILDPKSRDAIEGFRVSGPTMVAKRTAFEDDANVDRGVVIMCEAGERPFPLELIDRERYSLLRDKLAFFWLEHYCDPILLPSEQEMLYDPVRETTEPRLRMAEHYFSKLAHLLGAEAEADLQGFVQEQVRARVELKSVSDEGLVIRVLHGLIVDRIEGYHHTLERDGSARKVVDTLSIEAGGPGRYIIAITRTPEDGGRDTDSQTIGISWNYIAKLANLASRREPGKILLPYSVRQAPLKRIAGKPVRTISFNLDRLDGAFRTFVPEYDPGWKQPFVKNSRQRGVEDFMSARSQHVSSKDGQMDFKNAPSDVPVSPIVTEVTEVTLCGGTNSLEKEEEENREGVVPSRSVTSVTSVTGSASGSGLSAELASEKTYGKTAPDDLRQIFDEKVASLQKKA